MLLGQAGLSPFSFPLERSFFLKFRKLILLTLITRDGLLHHLCVDMGRVAVHSWNSSLQSMVLRPLQNLGVRSREIVGMLIS